MKPYRFAMFATAAIVTFALIMAGCGGSTATATSGGKDASSTSSTSTSNTNGANGANGGTTATTSTTTGSTTTSTATDSGTTKSSNSAQVQVIHVTAKNFAWQLDKTEVKAGEPVRLIVTAAEGTHALTIPGTSVAAILAQQGVTQEVTFTPDKPGTLTLICTQFCGLGHGDMHTTLKVV